MLYYPRYGLFSQAMELDFYGINCEETSRLVEIQNVLILVPYPKYDSISQAMDTR